jgi:hypothetical protein
MSRLPKTPRLHLDTSRIVDAMRKRDRSEMVGGIILSIVGIFLLPFGPVLMGSITWILASGRHASLEFSLWLKHVAVCSLFIVPMGFYVARQGGSNAIDEAANDFADVGYFGRRQLAGPLLILILSLLGPGVMWYAIRKLIAANRFHNVPRDRAADVLGKLLIRNEGTDVFALLGPGEKLDQLLPYLEYLSHYDWIGANKDGDRVWASSEARNRLDMKSF